MLPYKTDSLNQLVNETWISLYKFKALYFFSDEKSTGLVIEKPKCNL